MLLLVSIFFLAVSFSSAQAMCTGAITITSPESGDVWYGSREIVWDDSSLSCDAGETVDLVLYKSGNLQFVFASNVLISDLTYDFDTTGAEYGEDFVDDDDYQIGVRITSQHAIQDHSEMFEILNNIPDPLTDFEIDLNHDWNLISSPLVMEETNIEQVLADIEDNVVTVWYFDSEIDNWRWYVPSEDKSTLNTFEDGNSYFIDMSSSDTLLVDGYYYSDMNNGEGLPPEYNYYAGWNMIGYTRSAPDEELKSDDYFADQYDLLNVHKFDTATQQYYLVSGPNMLIPGDGYWAYKNGDGNFVIPELPMVFRGEARINGESVEGSTSVYAELSNNVYLAEVENGEFVVMVNADEDDDTIRFYVENKAAGVVIFESGRYYSNLDLDVEIQSELLSVEVEIDSDPQYRMSEVEVEIEVEAGPQNIENIEARIVCDYLDIDESISISDINAYDDEHEDIEFQIPRDAEAGEYECYVYVIGQDENGVWISVETAEFLEVKVEEHHLKVSEIYLEQEEYFSGAVMRGRVLVDNLGTQDATEVMLRVYSLDVDYNHGYDLKDITTEGRLRYDLTIPLAEDLEAGTHRINAAITMYPYEDEQEARGLGEDLNLELYVQVKLPDVEVPEDPEPVPETPAKKSTKSSRYVPYSGSHGGSRSGGFIARSSWFSDTPESTDSPIYGTDIVVIDESDPGTDVIYQQIIDTNSKSVCDGSMRGFFRCLFDWLNR